jgi:hypothetical protein
MPVTPSTQAPEFLHFRVLLARTVFDGQAFGVKDTNVAAESEQDASNLVRKQFGIRPGPV